jgi:hypothetical protein
LLTIRGLMELKWAETPVPIEEVESAAEIVKRLDRRDELGSLSARRTDAGRRDEPHRRPLEHG